MFDAWTTYSYSSVQDFGTRSCCSISHFQTQKEEVGDGNPMQLPRGDIEISRWKRIPESWGWWTQSRRRETWHTIQIDPRDVGGRRQWISWRWRELPWWWRSGRKEFSRTAYTWKDPLTWQESVYQGRGPFRFWRMQIQSKQEPKTSLDETTGKWNLHAMARTISQSSNLKIFNMKILT